MDFAPEIVRPCFHVHQSGMAAEVSFGTAGRGSTPAGFAAGITDFSASDFSAVAPAVGVTALAVDNGRKGAGGPGKIGRTGFDGGEAVGFALPEFTPSPRAPLPVGEGSKLPSPLASLPVEEGSKLPSPPAPLPEGEGSKLPALGPFRAPTEGWSGEGSLE